MSTSDNFSPVPAPPRAAATAFKPVSEASFVLLLLLPFWVDTGAMLLYLATGSAGVYSIAVQVQDLIALAGLCLGARRGIRLLLDAYGGWIVAPALLYAIALGTTVLSGSGNHEFILAAMRYTVWVIFVTAALSHPRRSVPSTGASSTFDSALGALALVLAALSVVQLLLSEVLAGPLQTLHEGFTPAEKTNAVLTSISLGKSFASLTLRNPIELSYVGLLILCHALPRRANFLTIAAAWLIILCGRSNTTLLASLAIALVHSLQGSDWLRRWRWPIAGILVSVSVVFLWFLPEIYVGPGSNWDDLIVVLSYQRLGMLLALPELLSEGGSRLLIGGMPTPLIDLVETLYNAGLLPELFADGGAIAVFDIMWFGFMLVGGLPFVLGGAVMVGLGLRSPKGARGTPEAASLRLYAVGLVIISFSSQILLSRYGLFFFCYFLADAAVRHWHRSSNPVPTSSNQSSPALQ
ncbi:hypothetical protein [Roseateles sp.]|uniref:hypothetical protein n=1 Tax=Roseateles sp. TaxID=1971397 RepID=UPI002F3F4BCE